METICKLFGYTRQAWYKGTQYTERKAEFCSVILEEVEVVRSVQSRIGTVKLLKKLRDRIGQKMIGRDALYQLLRAHKKLIKPRRVNRPKLTDGNGESIYIDHRKQMVIERINQLWSCDITYFRLTKANIFCYLTLVIDEHSHKILGFHVSLNMTAEETLKAYKQAVDSQKPTSGSFEGRLYFHSDRGGQFKSLLFKEFHKEHGIVPSMCRSGKSSENPVAERLNGILKNELLCTEEFNDIEDARFLIAKAVEIYNSERPHLSCGLLTPNEAHQPEIGPLKKMWRQRKPRMPTKHPN